MRGFVSIFLALVMALLASGAPQAAHERMHEAEDAREELAAALAARRQGHAPAAPARHSHEDCPICEQFRAPVLATSYTVWLIDTGAWVEFVSLPAVSQRAQGCPARISCRGPPESSRRGGASSAA